jgi:hypothetical protein
LLLLSAAILAVAFGQREFVLALPVLVLAGFPLLQVVRVVPSVMLLPQSRDDLLLVRVRRSDDRLGVRAGGALRRIVARAVAARPLATRAAGRDSS